MLPYQYPLVNLSLSSMKKLYRHVYGHDYAHYDGDVRDGDVLPYDGGRVYGNDHVHAYGRVHGNGSARGLPFPTEHIIET